MANTVFFSWQADTSTLTGRNFLERTLERALGRLNRDLALYEPERGQLEIDRDTKGVAGQPPIVETIFNKIDAADVFVPDLTFVGKRLDGRLMPNPNVLVEYGWALKSLGHGRIVPVMNAAYGEPADSMPFDMRHLRNPITYNLPDDASEEARTQQREKLCKLLEEALGAVLKSVPIDRDGAGAEKKYVPVQPGGRSRFRGSNDPLGITDRLFEQPQEITLAEGPAIWLRIMPVNNPGRTWTSKDLRTAANNSGIVLTPLCTSSGFSELRADDGIGNYVSGSDPRVALSVTFAFEFGEVWAVNSWTVQRIATQSKEANVKPGLPIYDIERELGAALTNYVEFLKRLNISPPYKWEAGIEGMRGFGLYYPPPLNHTWTFGGPQGACVADSVVHEGTLSQEALPYPAIWDFTKKVFDKCGRERPDYLNPGAT